MECRYCEACGEAFRPRAQVRQQRFCGKAACQRERRRRWHAAKRCGDSDYRGNQAEAQRAWARDHPEYWREYRRTHPEYTERNRESTRLRQRERRRQDSAAQEDASMFAKMDASTPISGLSSGTYRLVTTGPEEFAKTNEWIVEITVLSRQCGQNDAEVTCLQREDVMGGIGRSC
jgi:hypothetical protein